MITIVNPPNPPGKVSNKDMMGGFGQCYPASCVVKVPPLDIPYAAAVLRAGDNACVVIDCLGEDLSTEALLERLRVQKPDMVFVRTSTPTLEWDASVAERIKEAFGATVVFFGPHIGVAPDAVLSHAGIDAIIFDEPEFTMRDIASHGLDGTLGVWRKHEGRVIKAPRREAIANLDALPFPAWDMLPNDRYTIGDLLPGQGKTLFMQTSRGCPYTCSYCPYPVAQGHKYRMRSPQNVVDEFVHLAKAFGARNVLIRDPEFTLDRKRIVGICEGLLKAGVTVSWRCETRADTLDVELLELMAKAGCVGINMGIETKSKDVCEKVERFPLKPPETFEILRKCRALGINTFCFFIAGLPGDTWSTLSETIGYAIELDPDTAQFTVATPYLGTGLERWAAQNNFIESTQLDHVTGFEAMIRNENMSLAEILWFRNEAQRLVDLAHDWKKQGLALALPENGSSSVFLANLALVKRRALKRVIVFGTEGVSIPALKGAGLDAFVIVDDQLAGRTLGGVAVLSPWFIKIGNPDAIIVAEGKRVSNLPYAGGRKVVCVDGKEDRLWKAKTAASAVLRKLRVWMDAAA